MLFILNSGRIIVSTLTLKPRSTFSFTLTFQLYTNFIPWLYKIKIFLRQAYNKPFGFLHTDNTLSTKATLNVVLHYKFNTFLQTENSENTDR